MNSIQAVLFDMDGTLLQPVLHENTELLEYKTRWGIAKDDLIVPSLKNLPLDATTELWSFEAKIAATSILRVGAIKLLGFLVAHSIKTALVTNNSRISAVVMCERHKISFDTMLSRDEAPMKPAPDMLLQALQMLKIRPENAIMVGDTKPDAASALAAGIKCFLLDEPYNAQIQGTNRFGNLLELLDLWDSPPD
jgi:HAD superfamily hydrolase (TIGR01509 family)